MSSLASRITLVTVVLVSLAVAIALGGSWLMSKRIASEAVTDSLAASQAMQRYLQNSRARELALTTDLLASDSDDTSYLIAATRGQIEADREIDRHSILDLIDERRAEMGFDFAMMLDPNGDVLARTDRPEVTRQSLADHPLVMPVLDDLIPEYGPWREGNQLFSAAVVPVTTAFELIGFLITGLAIDDEVAEDIKRVTGVDMAFLTLRDGRALLGASTLNLRQGERLIEQLRASKETIGRLAAGEAIDRLDIEFNGENWVARIEPIRDFDGQVLGAVMTVDSLDAKLAGHRTMQSALISGGVLAILIALLLSHLVARRIARPVSALAEVADQAAQGDYDQEINITGKDEVGTLSRAIRRLLSDLREQQEIAGYVSDLSQQLDESRSEPAEDSNENRIGPPRSGRAWTIALEWPTQDTESPDEFTKELEQWLPSLSSAASLHKASLVPAGTARLLLVLDVSKTENLTGLLATVLHRAADAGQPPAMALALGDVVSTDLTMGRSISQLVSGKPVIHCERLLREAGAGRLLVSPPAFKELEERLKSEGAKTELTAGRVSQRRYYRIVELATAPDQTRAIPSLSQSPAASTFAAGQVLGERFEIIERLGEGAMGSVYKARDRKLEDLVALKVLKSGLANDPEYLERMKSEIRLARRITHPNVLRTHDFYEIEGMPVISMEYVRGVTLAQLLKRSQRLSLAAGLRVSTQVLQGLDAAHQAGVLHRDIKPGNIILDPRGNVRLMDFGIARQFVGDSPDLTEPGTIVGTANYLPPEVLLGKPADQRSDIYSMGVMLNEMFTGRLPFEGESSMEICMAHVQKTPDNPSKYWPDIPQPLETIILKCLAKEPDERHESAAVLLDELLKVRRQSAAEE